MRLRTTFFVVLASVAFPGLALAHLGLQSPESRYGENVLKAGPCGKAGGQRTTDKVYEVKSGATINVVWDEYIDHPGHFRISFDDDGDDFQEPSYTDQDGNTNTIDAGGFTADEYAETLIDLIADKQGGGIYNQSVTLPDIECDNCTLQAIQVMYDKPPYDCDTDPTGCNDVYHQCVDLVLSADGPDTPTLIGGGGGGGGADAGGGGGNPGGPDGGTSSMPPKTPSGGCAVGGDTQLPGWLALLGLIGLAPLRRRRGRRAAR